MITVKLPDGATAQFPDGTPMDVMKAAIAKKYPPTASAVAAPPPVPAQQTPPAQQDWANNPIADQLSAGFTAGVNAIPIAGPSILSGLEQLKAKVQGRSAEDVAATDQAQVEANPVASTVGTVAGTVLPFMGAGAIPGVGRALGMTGGLGSRIGLGAASGSVIGGADSLARGSTTEEAGQSAALGGALGAAFPLAGAGLRRLVSPFASSASQRAAAQTMQNEGVTLTAGQRTGSKKLKYLESELGGGAAETLQERQGREFTRAVLRRAGVNADSAEPQVIDQAFTDIGGEFDRLAANNSIRADRRLMGDLQRTWYDYAAVTPKTARAPIVAQAISEVAGEVSAQGGVIAGNFYKTTRSRLDRLARSMTDPEAKAALRDVMGALDQGMERTIAATNPGDLGAWRAVRRNYKNMLVIEKAATGAGEQAAAGIITPARIRSAAIQQNRRTYARGNNDFTDLANAAVQTMTPLPQSGTAPRLAARGFSAIPAAIGAAAGSPGGLLGAAAGAVAGAAAPAIAGRAALSAPGRAILSNQLMAGPAGRALVAPAGFGLMFQDRKPVEITVRGGR